MGEKPLLSICIPTYNQPEAAKRLLENIAPQLTSEVEVVVRDDSTNSETERIVKEFQKKFLIRYFHGKKGGLDVAIIFLTQEAKGKYVWWFGDDLMDDGAIDAVLDKIRRYPNISLLYVNSRQTTDKIPSLKFGQDDFFKSRDEVIEEVVDMLGFITATILKRDEAISGIEEAEKRIGTAWVCLYLVLHVLSQGGRYYFLSKPYVLSKPRDPKVPAWYDGFTVFAINLFHIVKSFKGKFSKKSIKKMLSRNFNGIWRGIIVYRARGYSHGLGSKDPKIWPLFKLYWSFGQFWLALPFLLLPRWLDRVLYFLYRKIRGK